MQLRCTRRQGSKGGEGEHECHEAFTGLKLKGVVESAPRERSTGAFHFGMVYRTPEGEQSTGHLPFASRAVRSIGEYWFGDQRGNFSRQP